MKKLTALVIVFMLFVSCFNVSAVSAVEEKETDFLAEYDYSFGEINEEYTLAYKNINLTSDTEQCSIIGGFCFYSKEPVSSLFVVNNKGESDSLDIAYGKTVGDEDMDVIVRLICSAKENGVEPFTTWNIVYIKDENNAQTEPTESSSETVSTEPQSKPDVPPGITTESVYVGTDATEPKPPDDVKHPTTVPTTHKPTSATEKKPPATVKPSKNSSSNSKSTPKLNFKSATLKCGKTVRLYVKNKNGKSVKFSSGNKRIAKVSKKGVVTSLKKGIVKIYAKVAEKKLYCTVRVVSSPKLSRTSVKVRRGKTAIIKITGRASSVKNTYKDSKKAKILGKRKSNTFKIRGLRRGKTFVKVKVNGVVFKIKVKII